MADLFAFIFRRYAEIKDYGVKEEWTGEKELIDEYVESLAGRLLPKPARWPTRNAFSPISR